MTPDLWCREAPQEEEVHRAQALPADFREDVVRVARNREPGVRFKDIAKDFGISEPGLTNWLAAADVEYGVTAAENAELRAAKRRIRLLEQENEVLRRAAAYLSQAQLPGE